MDQQELEQLAAEAERRIPFCLHCAGPVSRHFLLPLVELDAEVCVGFCQACLDGDHEPLVRKIEESVEKLKDQIRGALN